MVKHKLGGKQPVFPENAFSPCGFNCGFSCADCSAVGQKATLEREAAKKAAALAAMPNLKMPHTNKNFFKAVLDEDGEPIVHIPDGSAIQVAPDVAGPGQLTGEYLDDGITPQLVPKDESFMEVQHYKEDGITPILKWHNKSDNVESAGAQASREARIREAELKKKRIARAKKEKKERAERIARLQKGKHEDTMVQAEMSELPELDEDAGKLKHGRRRRRKGDTATGLLANPVSAAQRKRGGCDEVDRMMIEICKKAAANEMEWPCDEEKMKITAVLHEAVKTVARLAADSKARREAVKCGAVPPLVKLIERWQVDKVVLQYCCEALENFTLNKKARGELLKCGGVDLMIQQCEDSMDTDLLRCVCGTLAHVTESESEMQKVIATKAAVAAAKAPDTDRSDWSSEDGDDHGNNSDSKKKDEEQRIERERALAESLSRGIHMARALVDVISEQVVDEVQRGATTALLHLTRNETIRRAVTGRSLIPPQPHEHEHEEGEGSKKKNKKNKKKQQYAKVAPNPSPEDKEAQLEAERLEKERKRLHEQAGLIFHALTSVSLMTKDRDVMRGVAGTFANLTVDRMCTQKMVDAGGLTPMVSWCKVFPQGVSPAVKIPDSSQSEQNRKEVLVLRETTKVLMHASEQLHQCRALMGTLNSVRVLCHIARVIADTLVLQSCTYAMMHMATEKSSHAEFNGLNQVTGLINLLKTGVDGSDDPLVLAGVCGTLRRLCAEHELRRCLVVQIPGAITAIIGVLAVRERHQCHTGVLAGACHSLWQLASYEKEKTVKEVMQASSSANSNGQPGSGGDAHNLHGPCTLLEVLSMTEDSDALIAACGTLKLLSSEACVRANVAEEGTLGPLINLPRWCHDYRVVEEGLWALALLLTDDTIRAQLNMVEYMAPLVEVVEEQLSPPIVLRPATTALLHLCQDPSCRPTLKQAHAPQALLGLCTRSKDDVTLEAAAGCCCALASEKEYMRVLAKSAAIPVMVRLCRKSAPLGSGEAKTRVGVGALRGAAGTLCCFVVDGSLALTVEAEGGLVVLCAILEDAGIEDVELLQRCLAALYYMSRNSSCLKVMTKRRGTYSGISRARHFLGKDPPPYIQELMDKVCPGLNKLMGSLAGAAVGHSEKMANEKESRSGPAAAV